MRHTSKGLAAGLLLLTVACGPSTKLTSFWKDPSAGPFKFKKVLVMVISKDETIRRAAEDEVVRQITKTTAVPSYTLFPDTNAKDQDRMKAKIKEDGFDGAIVMRMVDKTPP